MRLANRHVYVVGDDAQHNATVGVLLSHKNVALTVDCWTSDTIAGIDRGSPADLILLDPTLPSKSMKVDVFLRMFANLRLLPALANVPVVAVSLADPGTLIPSLREMGFRGFLRKPLNRANFANQIADILDGKQVWEYR